MKSGRVKTRDSGRVNTRDSRRVEYKMNKRENGGKSRFKRKTTIVPFFVSLLNLNHNISCVSCILHTF